VRRIIICELHVNGVTLRLRIAASKGAYCSSPRW